MFDNPTEIIDINKLAAELQTLNTLIGKFDTVTNKEGKDENEGKICIIEDLIYC